jgi:predicted ATPase
VLGSNGWGVDQTLMLNLCSEGALTYFICGDLDASKDLIAEVIRRDDITIEEKYAVYDIKVKVHYAASEFDDSMNTAFDFRKQIGLPTLKNKQISPLIVLKEFLKTNRAMGKRSAEDIASLPELTEERVEMGQRMLELAANTSFIAQPTVFPLIVFLLVRASLKHGINASACDAFGGYGVILW